MPYKSAKILENNHHAYCLTGETQSTRKRLFDALKTEWGMELKGNPDFYHAKQETFRIDEARQLSEWQKNKSFGGGKKVFILEAGSITVEAQNALLKIFEEPAADTHFFLIGECVRNLIPTLQSRIYKISAVQSDSGELPEEIAKFLKAPLAKRLEMAKKFADDIKDEKRTKTEAAVFIQQLEVVIYQKNKTPDYKALAEIELCREYMSDRSAGVKMLLEYVAMVIPNTK